MNNKKLLIFDKLLWLLIIIICFIFTFCYLNIIQRNDVSTNEEITIEVKQNDIKSMSINEYSIMLSELNKKVEEVNLVDDKKIWFLEYKSLINDIEEISDQFHPPETIYTYYTDDEIYLMQQVIETEVYTGDFESKCNVASVILNRINDNRFGTTPYEIITAPNQFVYFRTNISEDTILALEYVFTIGDTTDGALFFHSNEKTEKFNDANYLFTDNVGHHFYK